MSLNDLKSAAMKVQLEESADNMDAFIDAAEEVAQKNGLDSPSKHRKKSSSVSEWLAEVERSQGQGEKENLAQPQAVSSSSQGNADDAAAELVLQAGGAGRASPTVDEAVTALAAQMGVQLQEPAAQPETGGLSQADSQAVDRLMAPHTDENFNENVKGKARKGVKFGAASTGDVGNKRDQIRYLNMRKSLDNRQAAGGPGGGGSNVVVITRRSKVSKMLDRADNRPSSAGGLRASTGFKSDSQEMMFREMKLVEDSSSAAKKKKHRKIIIKGEEAAKAGGRLSTQSLKAHQEPSPYERLTSAGRKKDIDQREKTYSRFEDAKECTFRPRIRKTGFSETPQDEDDHPGAKKKDNFVERQEAAERGRVSKIELDIGKSAYDALLDKKFCPQCKAKQSYDDIKEKRKRCNNCNIEYTTSIEWNKVKRDFYERQQGMLDGIDKKRQHLAEQLERERRKGTKMVYDRRLGKLVVQEVEFMNSRGEAKWDEDMEHDFFERSSKMEQRRQMHLKRVEDEMYGDIGVQSTGSSDLGGSDLYDSGVGGSRLFGLDAATAFLHRYEEDVKRRNAIKAEQRLLEKERAALLHRTVEDNLCEHPAAFRP